MRWSFRLGHIRGVPIEIHWLLLLLLIWVALQSWGGLAAMAPWQGLGRALAGVGLVLVIFACVLVHEVGHTVHAQALGIPVRRILLLPIGGLAELARLPERPTDELRVALAGPAANFALGLIFGALAYVWVIAGAAVPGGGPPPMFQAGVMTSFGLVANLALANFAIAVFNLMPAFPMDGGRILRSLLAHVVSRLAATRLVAWLSWAVGGLFILVGAGAAQRWDVPASLGLILVGLIALFGAEHEKALETSRLALLRILARDAVQQPTWTLSPLDLIDRNLSSAFYRRPALPVVVGTRLVGVLAREDLLAALRQPASRTVAHIMRTRFPYVRADESLWRAQQLILNNSLAVLPVLDGEALHGMLTPADIRAAHRLAKPLAPVEAPTLIPGGNSSQ